VEGESHDARSERLESRLRILTGALREFAEATTDYVRLVDVVAKTLADVVGDGCVVRMLAEDGWLSPVAVHFPIGQIQDAEKLERMKAFLAARRHMSELDSVRRLIETGEHVLMTHVDLGEIRASGSAAVLDLFETVGIHSLLVVALRIHGKSIGLLSLVRFRRHSRPFTEQDRHTAQALADHAALAIANAQLVQRLEGLLAERTAELKVLRGMLPICAWCKRIRDDDRGSWAAIETYVAQHSEATFTHGICPSCAESMQR
jgi:GAF domain-containing protein